MKLPLSVLTASLALFCPADEWTLTKRPPADDGGIPPAIPVWSRGETDTNHIDILIVIDASAKTFLAANTQSVREYAASCISDLNISLGHTGISEHFTFRLADVLDLSPCRLDDYELCDILAGFTPMLLASNPLNREIAERIMVKREECHADVVAILATGKNPIKYGESCPLTGDDLATGELDAKARQAYCVCKLDSIDRRHVLLHEIGHLMGAGHSDAQHNAPGPQLFPFSAAYRFHAGETPLTTVTGYPEIKDGIILPFFSSPDYAIEYTCNDGKTWRDIPIGTLSNDNSRTVIATFPLTAQYRPAKPSKGLQEFDRSIEFMLMEGEAAVGGHGDTIALRCGVNRSLHLKHTGVSTTDVTVTHLPPGFKYDEENGVVVGRATAPGRYIAFFTFRDGQTGLMCRRWVTFNAEALPGWATGIFTAENGRRRINVSDKGRIAITCQRGFKVDKKTFAGFSREEKDAEGLPVFVCEDGTRLIRDSSGTVGDLGVAVASDNVRHLPEAKRRASARRRANHNTKQEQNRKGKLQ